MMTEKSLIGVTDVARLTKHSYGAVSGWIKRCLLKPVAGTKSKFRLIDCLSLPLNAKVQMAQIHAFIQQNS